MKQIETGFTIGTNDHAAVAGCGDSVRRGRTDAAGARLCRPDDRASIRSTRYPTGGAIMHYSTTGSIDECIAEAQRTLKLAPALALPPYFIALSLIMKDQPQEAQRYLDTLPADLTVRLSGEAIVAGRLGDTKRTKAKLDQLRRVYGDAASYQFAQVHAQLGETDKAFEALERGLKVNDPGLNTLARGSAIRSDQERSTVCELASKGRRHDLIKRGRHAATRRRPRVSMPPKLLRGASEARSGNPVARETEHISSARAKRR